MRLSLDPSRDVLSLYAPFVTHPVQRIQHTRSVLLHTDTATNKLSIVSSVTFALVLSLPKTVPIHYLLRYMLLAYTRHAYASFSKQSDAASHATLDTAYLTKYALLFLREIDRHNRRDYEQVMKQRLLDAKDSEERAWQWHGAGDTRIEDEEYRQMRNINFIRDVKPVSISTPDPKSYKDAAQYRILFDNHLILYYFLTHFKRGTVNLEHKETKFECPIVLLDPVATSHGNRHERFEGSNYIYYVEKQLDAAQNTAFHTSLNFKETFEHRGGLLLPSTYDATDTSYAHQLNTLEAMYANASFEDNSGQRLTKRQYAEGKRFRLSYNRFYVDLSTTLYTHVLYYEREKMLTSDHKEQGRKAKAVKQVTVVKLAKNQPTLQSVVAKIPEECKRKLELSIQEDELSVTKKPRLEQATLSRFFK